jgi:hypothetical protein
MREFAKGRKREGKGEVFCGNYFVSEYNTGRRLRG